MILVVLGSIIFDCFIQRMSIQNGLLKSIKYSTFEVSVLKEIVDGYEPEMNILGIDLTRFCIALMGQTRPEK